MLLSFIFILEKNRHREPKLSHKLNSGIGFIFFCNWSCTDDLGLYRSLIWALEHITSVCHFLCFSATIVLLFHERAGPKVPTS